MAGTFYDTTTYSKLIVNNSVFEDISIESSLPLIINKNINLE